MVNVCAVGTRTFVRGVPKLLCLGVLLKDVVFKFDGSTTRKVSRETVTGDLACTTALRLLHRGTVADLRLGVRTLLPQCAGEYRRSEGHLP